MTFEATKCHYSASPLQHYSLSLILDQIFSHIIWTCGCREMLIFCVAE